MMVGKGDGKETAGGGSELVGKGKDVEEGEDR